jgi:hypothetical protein
VIWIQPNFHFRNPRDPTQRRATRRDSFRSRKSKHTLDESLSYNVWRGAAVSADNVVIARSVRIANHLAKCSAIKHS